MMLLGLLVAALPAQERAADPLAPPVPIEAPQQGRPPAPPPWSAGIGTVIATRPYFGGETRITPIPVVRYQGERLTFEGPFARYELGTWRGVTFNALARYRFDGYEEDDGDVLDGMERDDTIDLGVRAKIPLGRGADLRIEALTDVLGRHEGAEVAVSVGRTFRTGKLFIVPTVGVRWQSSNLANYYFGVLPGEARAGRPAYEPGETAGFDFAVAARYFISERTAFAFVARQTVLGEEIRDSPIVDDATVTSFIASLTYSF